MNRKQRQAENILQHGFKLQRIYKDAKSYGPVELCKKLHRIETRAHRLAEEMCCIPDVQEKHGTALDRIEKKVNEILGRGPKIFVNRDPRGYALKIRTKDAESLDIHKDWGGYGIICPDF